MDLPRLSDTPSRHPDLCLSISTKLIRTLAAILAASGPDRRNDLVLSVGSGSGLLEAHLLNYLVSLPNHASTFTVQGVEVRSSPSAGPVNKYLPEDHAATVRGTWELSPLLDTTGTLLFVYPRDPGLVSRYLESAPASLRAVIWLGPRADWEVFGSCFQGLDGCGDVSVMEGEDAGVAGFEMMAVLRRILLLANSIVMTISVNLGFGMHLLDITFGNREKLLLLGSMSTTFSTLSAVISKTSFGLTLLRLTQVGYEKTRVFVWVIMVSMNLLMFCDALYSWVECQPSRKHWEIFTDGTCWSPDIAVKFGIAAGAYSGCMDVIMALLPWRIIWETRMERREKIGVLVAMSMGLCAGAAAFAKCSQIPQILYFDETYTGASLVIWGAAEPAITIMGASIPALRVLLTDFKHFTQRRFSDQSESQGSNFDFWDDGSRKSRRSLFKWDVFGSSKSVDPSKATGTITEISCSEAMTLAPPAGLAAHIWQANCSDSPPILNCEMFGVAEAEKSADSTPLAVPSISPPQPTRPALSHKCPNLSQQFEDFLSSRSNSYTGTLTDSIYEGEPLPVINTVAVNEGTSAKKAIKKRFLNSKKHFAGVLKGAGKDEGGNDAWSFSSVLEHGQGGKGALLLHSGAPACDHFVVVQTTEVTVEFE
ncbi:hypothetical protein diail_3931 [Diaporthe ilicicola]|nr:hypothetical protein diail_3931 [Diaporthe ilicicola]